MSEYKTATETDGMMVIYVADNKIDYKYGLAPTWFPVPVSNCINNENNTEGLCKLVWARDDSLNGDSKAEFILKQGSRGKGVKCAHDSAALFRKSVTTEVHKNYPALKQQTSDLLLHKV